MVWKANQRQQMSTIDRHFRTASPDTLRTGVSYEGKGLHVQKNSHSSFSEFGVKIKKRWSKHNPSATA